MNHAGPAAHATCFRQAEAGVAWSTNSPEAHEAALAVLYAYRPDTHVPDGAWTVTLQCSDIAEADLGAIVHAPSTEIGPNQFARTRQIGAHARDYWIEQDATLIRADHAMRTIAATCATGQGAAHFAPRIIRQAMTAQLLAAGAVYAHTAAFAYNTGGVLIFGHQGQGKTSTLLSALRLPGAAYVTNDRLLLRAEGDSLTGYPWPMELRVAAGTLLAHPHLAELAPPDARALTGRQLWQQAEKVAITPSEFGKVLTDGSAVHDRVRPSLLLWPYFGNGRTGTVVEQVPADQVARELTTTRLFMTNPVNGTDSRTNHWLVPMPGKAAVDRNLADVVQRLAALPCVRILSDGSPGPIAAAVRDVLDEVPART